MKNRRIPTLIFLLLVPSLVFAQTCRRSELKAKLKNVTELPYIDNTCKDFWAIVGEGKTVVPLLIKEMTDVTVLKEVYVPYFGGEYTVADVAYVALSEIIADLPTFEFMGITYNEAEGYWPYWNYVRDSKGNRRKFRKAVAAWYDLNKDYLEWVESSHSLTGDCANPVGGHYRLQQ